ncbi:MAG: DUF3006 domain-containing protein [Bacillota bacterium]
MLTVDRFEGEWAVVEYQGTTFNLPKTLLPSGAKEGDVLHISIAVDIDTTNKRKSRIKSLEDDLFR